jgi:hypothetical protein
MWWVLSPLSEAFQALQQPVARILGPEVEELATRPKAHWSPNSGAAAPVLLQVEQLN